MAVRIGQHAVYKEDNVASSAELQAVLSGGQNLVLLGEGTYNLDAPITIPTGVTVRGDGPGVTTIKWNSSLSVAAAVRMQAGSRLEGATLQQGSSGLAARLLSTLGDECVVRDLRFLEAGMLVSHEYCRVRECLFEGNGVELKIAGDNAFVENNAFVGCLKAILVEGAAGALIQNNKIAGNSASGFGVHVTGTSDQCVVLMNQIKSIQSNGIGVYLDATGVSNQIAHNIFWGAFGVSGHALQVDSGVPSTNQIIGNQSKGATPASARFQPADFASAAALGNL